MPTKMPKCRLKCRVKKNAEKNDHTVKKMPESILVLPGMTLYKYGILVLNYLHHK